MRIVDHRTHDFDDGSIATVYSRIAPVKLHENEANEVANHLAHVSKRLKIFGEESKEVGEHDKGHNKLVGSSQVKGKIVEVGDDNNMDIDQPETQSETSTSKDQESSPTKTTETNFKLLSDDEIEKADKGQLIDLKKRIEKELEIREQIEADSSSKFQTFNYQVSTQKLKDELSKTEDRIKNYQTSNASTNNDNNKSPNGSGGIIVAVAVVVSALAIGGIAFVKSKLGKSKKK